MSENVIVALFGVIGVLITTLGGIQIAMLNTTRKHSKQAKEQLVNEHQDAEYPNLRENIDANQRETKKNFKTLFIRVNTLATLVYELQSRTATLESTQDRRARE